MTLRLVIMGVSGCGKTSLGEALAARGALRFVDGDTLHPPENIAKMASGTALDDADRAPWLDRIAGLLAATAGPIAVGCSALRRIYRDRIRAGAGGPVQFLHLHAPQVVLAARVAQRQDHFMPPSLLDSQFATLEMLEEDESGRVIDIAQTRDRVEADALDYLRELRT